MERKHLHKGKRIDNKEWVFDSYAYTFQPDKTCVVEGIQREAYLIIEENGNI